MSSLPAARSLPEVTEGEVTARFGVLESCVASLCLFGERDRPSASSGEACPRVSSISYGEASALNGFGATTGESVLAVMYAERSDSESEQSMKVVRRGPGPLVGSVADLRMPGGTGCLAFE